MCVIEETAFTYCSRVQEYWWNISTSSWIFIEVRDILRGIAYLYSGGTEAGYCPDGASSPGSAWETLDRTTDGRHLTGPWMQIFYTSADNEINHVQAIEVVKQVVALIKKVEENPLQPLTSGTAMFGQQFSADPLF